MMNMSVCLRLCVLCRRTHASQFPALQCDLLPAEVAPAKTPAPPPPMKACGGASATLRSLPVSCFVIDRQVTWRATGTAAVLMAAAAAVMATMVTLVPRRESRYCRAVCLGSFPDNITHGCTLVIAEEETQEKQQRAQADWWQRSWQSPPGIR